MKWQEYQLAVSKLYTKLASQGQLQQDIRLPDGQTGRPRQVDVWWTIELAGHSFNILIDAKFRKRIDVKDVEEVLSLGTAVGANKCVLVAPHGWTCGASAKAYAARLDLRLFSIEEALRILDISFWLMCPVCNNDCIIIDQAGLSIQFNDHDIWCVGGRCRECKAAALQCGDCKKKLIISEGQVVECSCSHGWNNRAGRLFFRYIPSDPVWVGLDKLDKIQQGG